MTSTAWERFSKNMNKMDAYASGLAATTTAPGTAAAQSATAAHDEDDYAIIVEDRKLSYSNVKVKEAEEDTHHHPNDAAQEEEVQVPSSPASTLSVKAEDLSESILLEQFHQEENDVPLSPPRHCGVPDPVLVETLLGGADEDDEECWMTASAAAASARQPPEQVPVPRPPAPQPQQQQQQQQQHDSDNAAAASVASASPDESNYDDIQVKRRNRDIIVVVVCFFLLCCVGMVAVSYIWSPNNNNINNNNNMAVKKHEHEHAAITIATTTTTAKMLPLQEEVEEEEEELVVVCETTATATLLEEAITTTDGKEDQADSNNNEQSGESIDDVDNGKSPKTEAPSFSSLMGKLDQIRSTSGATVTVTTIPAVLVPPEDLSRNTGNGAFSKIPGTIIFSSIIMALIASFGQSPRTKKVKVKTAKKYHRDEVESLVALMAEWVTTLARTGRSARISSSRCHLMDTSNYVCLTIADLKTILKNGMSVRPRAMNNDDKANLINLLVETYKAKLDTWSRVELKYLLSNNGVRIASRNATREELIDAAVVAGF